MYFPEGNSIVFYLDRVKYVGVPSDINFKVDVLARSSFSLKGSPYGDIGPNGKSALILQPTELERLLLLEHIIKTPVETLSKIIVNKNNIHKLIIPFTLQIPTIPELEKSKIVSTTSSSI